LSLGEISIYVFRDLVVRSRRTGWHSYDLHPIEISLTKATRRL